VRVSAMLARLRPPRQARMRATASGARRRGGPAGGAARLRSCRRAAPAADSAADAARVLRLLAPTRWLPAPLLAAAELLPALRRADVAQARARASRLQPGCGRLGRALAARGLPATVNRAPHHTCGGTASQRAGGVAVALAGAGGHGAARRRAHVCSHKQGCVPTYGTQPVLLVKLPHRCSAAASSDPPHLA